MNKKIVDMAAAFEVEGELLCCSCTLEIVRKSSFPHLFFCTTPPKEVKPDSLCPECNLSFGRSECDESAAIIVSYLKGEIE